MLRLILRSWLTKPLLNVQLTKRLVSVSLTIKKSNNNENNKSHFKIQDQVKENNDSKAEIIYEKLSNETLEYLAEKFDEIGESELNDEESKYYDVSYSSGVLTVKFSPTIGTYVLNKQTPNLQIWLSSPFSGPKRFDLIDQKWIYKRTGESLHNLLSNEISKCLGKPIQFD